ncbi:hypothetical protein [Stieleria marina]|uniref:Uncharacterized protein n=1 Tax=Stieleria marina TaxID=1930275 RepID=A0A517NTU2_9BACT|nr:hypothetical protein K239x_25010 [Planctomycetes bacterium K23_9]
MHEKPDVKALFGISIDQIGILVIAVERLALSVWGIVVAEAEFFGGVHG